MVVDEIFLNLVEVSRTIFSNVIEVPEFMSGPLVPIPYALFVVFGVFLVTSIISRFINLKRSIYLAFLDLLTAFVFGGFYLMVLVLFLEIPAILFVKLFKRKGKDEVPEMGKSDLDIDKKKTKEEPELDLGSEKSDELDLDSEFAENIQSFEKETKEFEEKPLETPQAPVQKQQKTCPYCGMPLAYIPQYGRYYCYKCRRYV